MEIDMYLWAYDGLTQGGVWFARQALLEIVDVGLLIFFPEEVERIEGYGLHLRRWRSTQTNPAPQSKKSIFSLTE